MRKQPERALLDVLSQQTNSNTDEQETLRWERKYKVITPLFGGGVTPSESDPVTIIRASEIRGQLRFWWRACRGGCPGQTADRLAAMRKAEGKIWGKAYKKGDIAPKHEDIVQITVEVRDNERGTLIGPTDQDLPAYAAFPLPPSQEERKRNPPPALRKARIDVFFQLTISFPKKLKKEIEAALWAWETFGGVGARTRRGFGALQLLDAGSQEKEELLPTHPNEVGDWLKKKLNCFILEEDFPDHVPHLSRTMKLYTTPYTQQPISVWKNLIKRLQDFRQWRPERRVGNRIQKGGTNGLKQMQFENSFRTSQHK